MLGIVALSETFYFSKIRLGNLYNCHWCAHKYYIYIYVCVINFFFFL